MCPLSISRTSRSPSSGAASHRRPPDSAPRASGTTTTRVSETAPVVRGLDDPALADAIERNQWEFIRGFAAVPGVEVVDDERSLRVATGVPSPLFNPVLRATVEPAASRTMTPAVARRNRLTAAHRPMARSAESAQPSQTTITVAVSASHLTDATPACSKYVAPDLVMRGRWNLAPRLEPRPTCAGLR